MMFYVFVYREGRYQYKCPVVLGQGVRPYSLLDCQHEPEAFTIEDVRKIIEFYVRDVLTKPLNLRFEIQPVSL